MPGAKQAYLFDGKIKTIVMKQIYYKGQGYDYKTVDVNGKRQYQLFKDGELFQTVEQSELDIKSIVSLILDSYYRHTAPAVRTSPAS